MTSAYWAARAWVGDTLAERVRIVTGYDGRIGKVAVGVDAVLGDVVMAGTVYPAAVNAHSHAFHRLLRGQTHAEGGSFWTWRERMYREAGRLGPSRYEQVATAVYAEMVAAGWGSVAEFHYVHHQVDGAPYTPPHAMESALARAAVSAGIRLTLLDTCYLSGGFGAPLSAQQRRFGDGSAAGWLRRHEALRIAFAAEFDERDVIVGTALHSVRAVPPDALSQLANELDPLAPVHMHVSEQQGENDECLAATGLTPVALLERKGLLGANFSAVHATHLTPNDIELLAAAKATVVMCPTTEADLGDGIGPARELRDAGVRIALGTDQHAVVDPLLEARALEHGERFRAQRRGRFAPHELMRAMSADASAALGRSIGELTVGLPCDLIEIDGESARTAGSAPDQLMLTATASDVVTVVIGGRVRAQNGSHSEHGDPGALLAAVMEKRT